MTIPACCSKHFTSLTWWMEQLSIINTDCELPPLNGIIIGIKELLTKSKKMSDWTMD